MSDTISHYFILFKSTSRDVSKLRKALSRKGIAAYSVIGPWEAVAEFSGKHEDLVRILESKSVSKVIFASHGIRHESLVVLGLDKAAPAFRGDAGIRCYVLITFERDAASEVEAGRLRKAGIDSIRVKALSKDVLCELPHVLLKLHFKDVRALRRFLLTRLVSVGERYRLPFRSTTLLVL